MLKKDEAVCIRAIDYSDTSQIVTLFCRQAGKTGAIAKGSKRPKSPFGGPIELLSHGSIVFTDRPEGKLSSLTEFERRGDFIGLRKRLGSLNCALFAVELLNSMTTDHDPHPELFEQMLTFLGDLEAAERDTDGVRLLILFQVGLLGGLGMGLILERCANCGDACGAGWPSMFFSSAAAGILCRNCEGSFPDRVLLTREAGRCLSEARTITTASDAAAREVEKTLVGHFTAILNHPPRMAKHFLPA
jgi:DNA repair protein RecO (recombination protein O)